MLMWFSQIWLYYLNTKSHIWPQTHSQGKDTTQTVILLGYRGLQCFKFFFSFPKFSVMGIVAFISENQNIFKAKQNGFTTNAQTSWSSKIKQNNPEKTTKTTQSPPPQMYMFQRLYYLVSHI